ncbi:glycosyltransferase family A protein [Marinobacter sp. C2H3]|uniref:glycosyltransferase family A protein n=1 Tax=Marinobacter sp. C2H3 TaxID=3119003 RepID=UPI00300ED1E2
MKEIVLSAQYLQSALSGTGGVVGNDRPHDIIVSLTTYGKRLNNVYLTIESLFQQSLKPDRILLWIDSETDKQQIPEILRLQEKRGFEIRYMERDLGPYSKFFYTLQAYPESLIITVDDDTLYPPDMVDMLYRAWTADPTVVPCHRAHAMIKDSRGGLIPYKQWPKGQGSVEPSLLNFPTGVGGVLYFPGCFDDNILNKDLFMSICPNSDDIWLKAMTLKKGTRCRQVDDNRSYGTRFLTIEGSQAQALKRGNKSGPMSNDVKLKAVWDHFDLWQSLKD